MFWTIFIMSIIVFVIGLNTLDSWYRKRKCSQCVYNGSAGKIPNLNAALACCTCMWCEKRSNFVDANLKKWG